MDVGVANSATTTPSSTDFPLMRNTMKFTSHAKAAMRVATCSALACALLALAVGSADSHAQTAEAPPIVIRSNTQESTIWAQDRVGAPATNSTQTIQSTNGAGTATGTVNATGANTVLSTTQVAQPASVVVAGDEPCKSEPKTWDGTCQATLPKTFSGQSVTATAEAPHTGSATFACQAGSWQPPTAVSCTSYCPAAPVTWGGSCSGTAGAQTEGQSQTVNNAAGGFTGSANFSCTAAGTFSFTGGTCSAAAPPKTVSYYAEVCVRYKNQKVNPPCEERRVLCSRAQPTVNPYAVDYAWLTSTRAAQFGSTSTSDMSLCHQLLGGPPLPSIIGAPGGTFVNISNTISGDFLYRLNGIHAQSLGYEDRYWGVMRLTY